MTNNKSSINPSINPSINKTYNCDNSMTSNSNMATSRGTLRTRALAAIASTTTTRHPTRITVRTIITALSCLAGRAIPPTAGYAGSAASSTPPISAEAEKERLRQEQEAAYLPSEPAPYAAGGSGSGRGSTLAVALPAASAADPASVLTEPSAPPLPDGATVGAVEAGDVVINSTSELATHHVPQQNTMYYPPPPQDPTHQPPGVVDKLERERLLLLDRSSQPYDVPTYVGPSSPPPPHIDSPSISGLAEARPEQVLHEKGSTEKVGLSSAPSEPECVWLGE